jgi:hypothetical protein
MGIIYKLYVNKTIKKRDMRLNNYNANSKRRGLGKEDMIHKAFARTVEAYKSINKLNCAWYSYDASGEKRNIITGALLKAKGLKAGHPDYNV